MSSGPGRERHQAERLTQKRVQTERQDHEQKGRTRWRERRPVAEGQETTLRAWRPVRSRHWQAKGGGDSRRLGRSVAAMATGLARSPKRRSPSRALRPSYKPTCPAYSTSRVLPTTGRLNSESERQQMARSRELVGGRSLSSPLSKAGNLDADQRKLGHLLSHLQSVLGPDSSMVGLPIKGSSLDFGAALGHGGVGQRSSSLGARHPALGRGGGRSPRLCPFRWRSSCWRSFL